MKTVTEYRNMPMIQEFIAGGAPAHLIEKLIDAFILGDVQDERNGTSGMSIMECVAEDIPMPQASELAFDLIDEIRAAMPQRTLQ